MSDSFDVLLRLLLDRDSAELTKKEIKSVGSALEKVDNSFKGQKLAKGLDAARQRLIRAGQEADILTNKLTKGQKNFIASANIIRRELTSVSASASKASGILNSIGNKSLLAGLGIGGGIIAEATAYAKKMGDATQGTRAFNAELEKIAQARGRIDAVLASQVLPILTTAAKVANLTAGIIEKNPQLASFALKGAALLVAFGALTKLAATGFKIYADLTYFTAQGIGLQAAKMQLAASTNQLLAAGKQSGGQIAQGLRGALGFGTTATATAGGVTAASVLAIVGVVLAGGAIGTLIYDQIAKVTGKTRLNVIAAGGANIAGQGFGKVAQAFGMSPEEANRKTLIFTALVAKLTGVIDESSPLWVKASELAGKASQNLQTAIAGLRGSENEGAIVEAFSQMREGELQAEKKFMSDRAGVINDAAADLLTATRNSASAIGKINERAAQDRGKIITNFISASRDDEKKLAQERANILRDSGIEIQRMEQDRLEKLRELERDHNDRVSDLAANRDALGLVLEQRAFDRARQDLDQSANIEIAHRRQDLAIRLQDLAVNFAAERAQKIATYQQALKDNEAQRAEEVKQQQIQLAEERRQIAENKAVRLRDLQVQYNEERLRLRQSFVDQVRDLDASLLGEQNKKRQYYALMLSDVDKFLAQYRSKLGAVGGATPGFAEGGYTPGGIIKSHPGEFIANQSTTRALESLLGGRLSQQALLAGVQNSMQYVDHSNYSGVTVADIRKIRRISRLESLSAIGEVFRR